MTNVSIPVWLTSWVAVTVLGQALPALGATPVASDDLVIHQQGAAQKPPPLNLRGTVEQVVAGAITVKSPTNESWILQIPPTTRVEVTGMAEIDMIRPDRFLRLTALVDTRRNEILQPVQQVTLIDVADQPGRRLGAFQPGADEPPQPGAAGAGMGMPVPNLGGAPPETDQVLYDIRGRVKSYRADQVILEVPNIKGTLRFQLAEGATVAVNTSDYSLAQPGDMVTSKGVQLAQKVARADEVTITLSTPLSDPKKRREPARPARPQRRPAKDEQRDGFEVASEMGQEETTPTATPPMAATPLASPPASQPEAADLVTLLTPEPGTTTWPSIRVKLGENLPVTFLPCKPGITRVDIRRQFGQPEKIFDLRGELPVGPDRSRKEVRWEMWVYGDVKVFLDETGMARYRQAR